MTTIPTAEFTTRDAAWLASTVVPADPPPGVTPNFDKFNINSPIYTVISVVFMLLALILTTMRIYTKAILTRALGWDDCMFADIFHYLKLTYHQMCVLALVKSCYENRSTKYWSDIDWSHYLDWSKHKEWVALVSIDELPVIIADNPPPVATIGMGRHLYETLITYSVAQTYLMVVLSILLFDFD